MARFMSHYAKRHVSRNPTLLPIQDITGFTNPHFEFGRQSGLSTTPKNPWESSVGPSRRSEGNTPSASHPPSATGSLAQPWSCVECLSWHDMPPCPPGCTSGNRTHRDDKAASTRIAGAGAGRAVHAASWRSTRKGNAHTPGWCAGPLGAPGAIWPAPQPHGPGIAGYSPACIVAMTYSCHNGQKTVNCSRKTSGGFLVRRSRATTLSINLGK